MPRRPLVLPLLAALLACSTACVRRELQIHSNPEGALVYLNGEEVGRTPATRPFTFYGTYDIVLRMDGYRTLKTKKLVLAPWWQWVPFDLPAELLPLTDRERLSFDLTPTTQRVVDPDELVLRAREMREKLPVTQPASPTTQP